MFTNKQTSNRMPLKTPTSLQYATLVVKRM